MCEGPAVDARRRSSLISETNDTGEARSIKVVCLSDTHGFHRYLKVPDGDILIHAGDFMAHGRAAKEVEDFNEWLGSLPHPH